jgi:hypothetical protein
LIADIFTAETYAAFGSWPTQIGGRALLLCLAFSDVDLLGYGERVINLNSEIADRALDLPMT